MKQLLFFLCFFFTFGSQTGCFVWRDNFLFYENSTSQNLTVHIYTTPRPSFIKIRFLKNIDDSNPLTLAYTLKNMSISFQNTSEFPITYQIDESAYFLIDNILHVNFIIKREIFETFRFFQISQSLSGNPDQLNYIGIKEAPLYNENSNFESGWCDTRYFRLAGRLGAQNEYTFIFTLCSTIIIIILCVFFRDRQPLKSRGIASVLCTFFLTVNLIGDYLTTNAITYEQYYYVDCFVNTFVLYPPTMST